MSIKNIASTALNNRKEKKIKTFAELREEVDEAERKKTGIKKPVEKNIFAAAGLAGKVKDAATTPKNTASEVGDFMRLFIEQLKCQDPLNPAEGKDFVAQLAQFNSVEQLQKVNKGIESVADSFRANRILSAASMIGKEVDVVTDKITINGKETISGSVAIPTVETDEKIIGIAMEIADAQGFVVHKESASLGNPPTGQLQVPVAGKTQKFTWGSVDQHGNPTKDFDGNAIKDGDYKIKLKMQVQKNNELTWVPLKATINTKVASVAVDKDGELQFITNNNETVNIEKLQNISNNSQAQVKQAMLASTIEQASAIAKLLNFYAKLDAATAAADQPGPTVPPKNDK